MNEKVININNEQELAPYLMLEKMPPGVIPSFGDVVPTQLIMKCCIRLIQPLNHLIHVAKHRIIFKYAKLATTERFVNHLGVGLAGVKFALLQGGMVDVIVGQMGPNVVETGKGGERAYVLHIAELLGDAINDDVVD